MDPRAILLTLSGIPEALKKHQSAKEKLQEMEAKLKGEIGLLQYEGQANLKKGLQQGRIGVIRDLIGEMGDTDTYTPEGVRALGGVAKKIGASVGMDLSGIDALMQPGAFKPPEVEEEKGLTVGEKGNIRKVLGMVQAGVGWERTMTQPEESLAALAKRTGKTVYEATINTILIGKVDPNADPRLRQLAEANWKKEFPGLVKKVIDKYVAKDPKKVEAAAKAAGMTLQRYKDEVLTPRAVEQLQRNKAAFDAGAGLK